MKSDETHPSSLACSLYLCAMMFNISLRTIQFSKFKRKQKFIFSAVATESVDKLNDLQCAHKLHVSSTQN